jgi:hypothetical protein
VTATVSLSALSTEYVQIPVAALVDGAAINPTSDTVQFAFKQIGAEPGDSDWLTGSWASVTAVNGFYYAQCLVGPAAGGNILPVATYAIWMKIQDSPEVPVRSPGLIQITDP